MNRALSFRNIRTWRGSQNEAFEELCYQLRDPTPRAAELIKTGSPDGGLEWYYRFRNGVEWGWQEKYSFDIDTLLKLMEESLKTVVAKRSRVSTPDLLHSLRPTGRPSRQGTEVSAREIR